MSPAEHTAEAQRLVDNARQIPESSVAAAVLAEAQVHATLALAGSVEFIAVQMQFSPSGAMPVEVVGR